MLMELACLRMANLEAYERYDMAMTLLNTIFIVCLLPKVSLSLCNGNNRTTTFGNQHFALYT